MDAKLEEIIKLVIPQKIDTGTKLDSNGIKLVVPFEHYTHTYI